MLINKDTQELVFIDKNTLTKVSIRPLQSYADTYFDHSQWLKGFLLGLTFIAAIAYAIAMSVSNMADASASFIDATKAANEADCTTSDMACEPVNIQGDI